MRILIIILIFGLILPSFSFSHSQLGNEPLKMPRISETLDEFLAIGKKVLNIFSQALKEAWQEAAEIWQKIIVFLKKLWNVYVLPKIEKIWQKILALFKKEIRERKEVIPKELEKEKKEIKEEAKKGVWQRFKEWLK